MDALDQAIWQRKTPDNKDLVHHSDRGSQYLLIKYPERLAEAEIDLSVGTVGDELLSNLVFEWRWSCCDLAGFGFNSVFEFDTGDDFGEVVKAA
jgi:transposase InsO family protein